MRDVENKICCLFGHRDCFALEESNLTDALENQIAKGVRTFYVGNHGYFDALVRRILRKLQKQYPHIQYAVVLAYLPEKQYAYDDPADTIYPEGLEAVPRKFAITKRNQWMIQQADVCVCYINRTWGGAYNSVITAKRKGIEIINLGTATI